MFIQFDSFHHDSVYSFNHYEMVMFYKVNPVIKYCSSILDHFHLLNEQDDHDREFIIHFFHLYIISLILDHFMHTKIDVQHVVNQFNR